MGLDMWLYRKDNSVNTDSLKKEHDAIRAEHDEDMLAREKAEQTWYKGLGKPEQACISNEKHWFYVSSGEEVRYWRKANAIHDWFVQVIQDGVDECQQSRNITKAELEQLVHDCETDNLQPVGGCFFGNTEKNEWYYETLKDTANDIKKLINGTDFKKSTFFYASSW
jgi:hypothetical protein